MSIESTFKELFGIDPRPEQVSAITNAQASIDQGACSIFVKADTGIGKSLINAYLALTNGGAYIVTCSRALQEQYANDEYLKYLDISVLKGKDNYMCIEDYGTILEWCDKFDIEAEDYKNDMYSLQRELERRIKIEGINPSRVLRYCGGCIKTENFCSGCIYRNKKLKASASKVVIANISMFYYMRYMREFRDSDIERKLVIYDEAHTLDTGCNLIFQNSVSCSFFDRYFKQKFKNLEEFSRLILKKDLTTEINFLKYLHEYMYDKKLEADNEDDVYRMHNLIKSIPTIVGSQDSYSIKFDQKVRNIEIDVIDVRALVAELNEFGPPIKIYTSATIHGEYTSKRLGVSCDVLHEEKNTWDVRNSPIVIFETGSIKLYRGAGSGLERMVEDIDFIINRKRNAGRGIIHTRSKVLMEYICSVVGSERFIPVGSTEEFDMIIDDFKKESHKNKILVSSSLSSGIDLKGDLSSFCIIVKPVTLDYGSVKKYSKFKGYADVKYAETFCQEAGRVIRSSSDRKTIYLLDNGFNRLEEPTIFKYMSPQWQRAVAVWVKNKKNRTDLINAIRSNN